MHARGKSGNEFSADSRVVKIGQRQLDAADVDVQSELFSLYENTMVSREESDADVQLAMKKFRTACDEEV